MVVRPGLLLHLLDAQGRRLGAVTVERVENGLLYGQFLADPAFVTVEPLFRAYEEAVNHNALGVVDDRDADIAVLGLQLDLADDHDKLAIHDVQIWSDGAITCRGKFQTAPTENGVATGAEQAEVIRRE